MGRKPIEIDDTVFINAYEQYKRRELTKKGLAEKLNVSRPTLDKMIKDYLAKAAS